MIVVNVEQIEVEQWITNQLNEEWPGLSSISISFRVNKSLKLYIEKEDEERERRKLRRAMAKQERLANGPPRLGRQKFEPTPMQVLLSEEVIGSLWKLKKCLKWKPRKSFILAIEVDLPGCSYNPPFEAHQDVLVVVVIEEMQKIYKKELQPSPLPSIVIGDLVLEEDRYFLDVDDETNLDLDLNKDECELENQGKRPLKIRKLTQAKLNWKATIEVKGRLPSQRLG